MVYPHGCISNCQQHIHLNNEDACQFTDNDARLDWLETVFLEYNEDLKNESRPENFLTSKSRDCGLIAEWVQLAINHLYWCAVASRGDPDLLVGAWTSMTGHVVDIHTDHPGIYAQWLHDPDRDDPQQGDALWEGINGESSSTPMHGELRAAAGSGGDESDPGR
ncbi:hypothetical protein HPB47_014748 [Ixodes persulcatus]|uniref:Uncharacterized protein n=1 Tax=Ixodes persulcatus TaxID=34615 RepID=A0AC60QXR5_IXOPE|nr:hypothetical protein HPB47_014748 [Ixodes persulcatus]